MTLTMRPAIRAAALLLATGLPGCVSAPGGKGLQGRQEVGNETVSLSFNRSACLITDVEIRSKGPALPTVVKTLITTVKGRTSGTYLIVCPPVVAGGSAACSATEISKEPPALSAGIGCGGWDAFAFTN